MSRMPETRESLILGIQDVENLDAWESFTEIYRPVIYRLARNRGLQHADAEDLSQQVLVSVARAIPNWQRDAESRFRHWLNRIIRNAILNALTRGNREPAVGGSDFVQTLARVTSTPEDLESRIELEYRRQVYRRAAEAVREQVKDETWRAFAYTVVEGLSTEEAAQRLGTTIGNIHAARSRIMRRLQAKVQLLIEEES